MFHPHLFLHETFKNLGVACMETRLWYSTMPYLVQCLADMVVFSNHSCSHSLALLCWCCSDYWPLPSGRVRIHGRVVWPTGWAAECWRDYCRWSWHPERPWCGRRKSPHRLPRQPHGLHQEHACFYNIYKRIRKVSCLSIFVANCADMHGSTLILL